MTLDHLMAGLYEYATNEQANKSISKALKEGGQETLARIVQRMSEPAKGYVGRGWCIVVTLILSI
jgi:pumilio RNA-binding family